MVTIQLSDKPFIQIDSQCYVTFLEQDFSKDNPSIKQIEKKYIPNLSVLLIEEGFKGYIGSSVHFAITQGKGVKHLLFVGLGKKDKKKHIDIEQYRRAIGKMIRIAEQRDWKSISLSLPNAKLFETNLQKLAEQTTIALMMASYHFDEYLTDKERIKPELTVTICHDDKKTVDKGFKIGKIIAESVNLSRYWVDLPPKKLTPPELAQKALEIAKKYGLKYTVFDENEVNQMGMGGLSGVSCGSDQNCQFVILEYDCGDKKAPTLGFVGKGITFDSGGLSLKPPAYMETMKEDMAGAAAVIATMQAIAQLKPKVNIIAITPLSENLPSGKATKPGDILQFYNGKTAEIKNTDAEGRLILADALSYAVKHYKLDALIDLATLTGACAYALGPFFTGLMSVHDDFAQKVVDAATRSGDRVWPLPLHDDYKPAIKSAVADISNIGSRKYNAGSITAAHFLKNFVNDVPWVHLDIAGTSFNVPDIPYYRAETATGAGVRLLIDLATNWKK